MGFKRSYQRRSRDDWEFIGKEKSQTRGQRKNMTHFSNWFQFPSRQVSKTGRREEVFFKVCEWIPKWMAVSKFKLIICSLSVKNLILSKISSSRMTVSLTWESSRNFDVSIQYFSLMAWWLKRYTAATKYVQTLITLLCSIASCYPWENLLIPVVLRRFICH